MGVAGLLLFAALTIRSGHGSIRAGCSPADPVIATLPAGASVDLRFALESGSGCYNIAARDGSGGTVRGYVAREALNGLEEFEREVRAAPALQTAVLSVAAGPAVAPLPALPPLSGEKISGERVLLYFDPQLLSPQSAAAMLGTLDREYSRISAELGCAVPGKLEAIAQSSQAYLRGVDALEWSAGLYDGRVRFGLPETGRELPVTAHAMAHACLAGVAQWPAWFQEGVARKLSGATLSAAERAKLRALNAERRLPRLENIAQSWTRMSALHAQAANALALAAVELLPVHLRSIVANPALLPGLTADLNRRLGL